MWNTFNNLHEPLYKTNFSMRVFVRQIVQTEGLYGETELTVYANVEFSAEYADGFSDRQLKDEIREEMREWCGCEHDCCGHFTGWASVRRKIGERTFLVKAFYAQNY